MSAMNQSFTTQTITTTPSSKFERGHKHIIVLMDSKSTILSTAIKEIRRGEQLMNLLQSHLDQLHTQETGQLSQGILQSLEAALALLNPKQPKNETGFDCSTAHGNKKKRSLVASNDNQNEKAQKRRKRPMMNNPREIVTPAPHFDGHQWRKYGQKIINKSKHPRNYYRCTHKDEQGCLATKIVQEEESNETPTFRVIYKNQHTCNESNNIVPQIIFSSQEQRQSNFFIFESKDSYSPRFNNIECKQEVVISSLSSQSEDSMCGFDSENHLVQDMKMVMKVENDTSSSSKSMAMDFPMTPIAYDEFDVDSILSLLA